MDRLESLADICNDHFDIRTMLGVLNGAASRLAGAHFVDADMIAGIVRFFEQFVAGCHELKEEQALFPRIAPLCTERERQAMRGFEQQHEHARRLFLTLRNGLEHADSTPAAIESLVPATARYRTYLREHLQGEERWFSAVLPRLLSTDEDLTLHAEFERLQRERIGPTGREWYDQLVADYRDIVATWSFAPPVPASRKP